MTSESVVSVPAADAGHDSVGHVVPVPVLLGVFAALITLTIVTVQATKIDLGSWNLHLAMGIATIKGALVVLYFMHLRYDRPFNALVFVVALLFLAIFLSITLLDTQQYQGNIRRYQQANPPAVQAVAPAAMPAAAPAAGAEKSHAENRARGRYPPRLSAAGILQVLRRDAGS